MNGKKRHKDVFEKASSHTMLYGREDETRITYA